MLCGSLMEREGKNEYMCMYGSVPLVLISNYHNILNQLYSNVKKKKRALESIQRWHITKITFENQLP